MRASRKRKKRRATKKGRHGNLGGDERRFRKFAGERNVGSSVGVGRDEGRTGASRSLAMGERSCPSEDPGGWNSSRVREREKKQKQPT